MTTRDVASLFLELQRQIAALPSVAYPAYLTAWDPVTGANTVTVTGTTTFTNLRYLPPPGDLAVGRVLLIRTPGKPVILGQLRAPTG